MTSSGRKTLWCLSRQFQSSPSLTPSAWFWCLAPFHDFMALVLCPSACYVTFHDPCKASLWKYSLDQHFALVQWLSTLCIATSIPNLLYSGYRYLHVSHRGRTAVMQMAFSPLWPPGVIALFTSLLSSGESGEDECMTTQPWQVSFARSSWLAGFQPVTLCQPNDPECSLTAPTSTPTRPHTYRPPLTTVWWLTMLYMASLSVPWLLLLPSVLVQECFCLESLPAAWMHSHRTDAIPLHAPLLPPLYCVQRDLSENPNLTCGGSTWVQTPQRTRKTLYDVFSSHIFACG